jgi:hypothetical protein
MQRTTIYRIEVLANGCPGIYQGYFVSLPTADELAASIDNPIMAQVARAGRVPFDGQATIKAAGVKIGRITVEALLARAA